MHDSRISFASYDEGGAILTAWEDIKPVEWCEAVSEGARRADELIEHIRHSDDRPMFGLVVREAVTRGKGAGLTGYLDRIAECLTRSAPFLSVMVFM